MRDRLAALMRFLADGPDRSDADLAREARDLGLQRSDLVIRRRLVETMRVLGSSGPHDGPASEEELALALAREPARYARPPRVSLTQIFFAADRRGGEARADAENALERLRGGDARTIAGDPFLHGARTPLLSERELAARFGDSLAREAFAMAPGEWRGPLPSAYGYHLVRVERRDEGGGPDLASARTRLVRQLEAERADERLRRRIAEWRSRYDVVVGGPAP